MRPVKVPTDAPEGSSLASGLPEPLSGRLSFHEYRDDIHAVLLQRAAAAHQSLQAYLRSRLIAEASRPTLGRYRPRGREARVCPYPSRVRCRRYAMTVPIVDASVLAVAFADDGVDGHAARARLRGQELVAPELLDLEVVSVLRGQMSAGSLEAGRAELALNDLSAMPLKRAPHRPLLRRGWELRENLTPYDASYVALAEALDVPPADGRPATRTAPDPRCQIELLRPTH